MSLTTKEKITKAIIQLQDEQPFWSRLILSLKISEDTTKKLPEYAGMGINCRGELIYKKEFVDKLKHEQICFVLAHEVSHLVFKHLIRLGTRNPQNFNFACDLIVNTILKMNKFIPPEQGIFADLKNEFKFENGKIITEVHKKTAEQIYDLIPNQPQNKKRQGQNGDGSSNEFEQGFDEHEFSKLSEEEQKEFEDKINEQIIQAAAYAKQRGKNPKGIEQYIKDIIQPQVHWKTLLYRYITNSLPHDYTWTKCSKKGLANNIMLPHMKKENLEIIIHIDTSGSIGQQELTTFLSECIGIAKSFTNIKMTMIQCDCAIQEELEVKNGNITKIKEMKIKGQGGTSHKPIWELIKKKYKNTKVLVSLTDLHSDVEISDKPNYDVIWVCPTGHGTAPFGKIIEVN